jgi:Uncharacterised nucleotidyltransferase
MMSPNTGTAAIEFDLLCLMVRPQPDLERALEVLRQGIDVAGLLRTAAEHSVRPQLMRSLAALSWEGVPAASLSSVAAFQRFHLVCSLSAARQLSRMAGAFAARGIRFAAFKGATLAKSLYGDLSAREYNDIDLIVPQAQFGEAEDVLASLGYRGAQGDRAFRRAFLAYQRQYAFIHPDLAVAIDLHWDFSGSHVPFPLTSAEIWNELEDVPIGCQHVPAVSGTNLALLLAGHGTKEAWRSLGWVCDFAMLLDRRPDLDWSVIHRRAGARGCGDSVLLACAMSQRLLGVPVPPALSRPVAERCRIHSIATALVDDLRRNERAPEENENLSDIDLCDTRGDRIRAVLKLALTRTVGDYQAMPLPPELWRVYHATRPFRLAAQATAVLR